MYASSIITKDYETSLKLRAFDAANDVPHQLRSWFLFALQGSLVLISKVSYSMGEENHFEIAHLDWSLGAQLPASTFPPATHAFL